MLSLPMIVIWSIGIPLSAFLVLYKNRNNLDDIEIRKYYLMIYQGLKPNRFYWEFVNTARKVFILSINVFLSTYSLLYRVLSIILLLIVFYRIQIKLEPYKLPLNNVLERTEVIAGTFTLFGGILYLGEEAVVLFNVFVFFLIVALNFYFIIFWLYCMLSTFRKNHKALNLIVKLLAMTLRIKEDIRLKTPKTKTHKKRAKPTFKKKKLLKGLKHRKNARNKKKFVKFMDKGSSMARFIKDEKSTLARNKVKENNDEIDNSKSNSKSKYIDESIFHSMNRDPTDKQIKDASNVKCDDMLEIQMEDEKQIKGYFEIKPADSSGFSDLFNLKSHKSHDEIVEKTSNEKDLNFNNRLSPFKNLSRKLVNKEDNNNSIRVFDQSSDDVSPAISKHPNPLLEDSEDSFNLKFFKKLEEAKETVNRPDKSRGNNGLQDKKKVRLIQKMKQKPVMKKTNDKDPLTMIIEEKIGKYINLNQHNNTPTSE